MEMTSPSTVEEENNYIIKPSRVVLIFMGIIGLVLTTFEAFNCDLNSNIQEIWKIDLPQEKYPEAMQNCLRSAIALIDLGRTITASLYVVAYALLLYYLTIEENPKLLLPWLYIGAVKNLFFEVIVILIASCLCCKSFSYFCINFIGCKFIGLGCSSYFWLNIRFLYKERKTELVTSNVRNCVQVSVDDISTENLILPTSYSVGNESFNESNANDTLFSLGHTSKQILPTAKRKYVSAHLIKSDTVFTKPRFSFDALMNRLENDWSMVQRLLVRRQAEKRMLTGLEGHIGNVCEALAIRACAFLALVPEHRVNPPQPEGLTTTADDSADASGPVQETVLLETVLNDENVPVPAQGEEQGQDSKEDLEETFSIKYLSTCFSKTSTLTVRTINYGEDAIYNVESVFSHTWEDSPEQKPSVKFNENDRIGWTPVLCDPSVVISLQESPGQLDILGAELSISSNEMIFQADILSRDFYFSKRNRECQENSTELACGNIPNVDDLIMKNPENIIDVNFWNDLSCVKCENEISESEGVSLVDSEIYESTTSIPLDEHKTPTIGENDLAISELSFELSPNESDIISDRLSLIPQLSSSYTTGRMILNESFEERDRNILMKQIENMDKNTNTTAQNKDNSCQTLDTTRDSPISIQNLKTFLNFYNACNGNLFEQMTTPPFVISPLQVFSNCWKNNQEKDKESETSRHSESKKNKRWKKSENTQTSPKVTRKRKGVQTMKKKIHFFEKLTKRKRANEIVDDDQQEDNEDEEDEDKDSENNSISLLYQRYKSLIENNEKKEREIQRNLEKDEIREFILYQMDKKLDQMILMQANKKSSINLNQISKNATNNLEKPEQSNINQMSKNVNNLSKLQSANTNQISKNATNNLAKPGPSLIKNQRPAFPQEYLRKTEKSRMKSPETSDRNRLTSPVAAGVSKMKNNDLDPIQFTKTQKPKTVDISRDAYRLPSLLNQERKLLYDRVGRNERVGQSRNRVELSTQVVAKNMLPIFRTNAQIRNNKNQKIEQNELKADIKVMGSNQIRWLGARFDRFDWKRTRANRTIAGQPRDRPFSRHLTFYH